MNNETTDNSWVKPFIHNMFSGDSKKSDIFMAEKMKHLNKPFYKYCYVCEESKRDSKTIDHNILNFENDELYFQDPSLFNDPFDCYLGFSQVEMMKDLLIATMKKEKKYTQEMKKAINYFFSSDIDAPFSMDKLDDNLVSEFMELMIPQIVSSSFEGEKERSFVETMLNLLVFKENMPLFMKMLQNKLTIADQQKIIDIMYDNETFLEYTKSSLENPNHSDFILNATRQEMKLKVETTPDFFMNGNGESPVNNFDFFEILVDSYFGKNKMPELSEVKEKFNEISKNAMIKNRKLISDKCKVTCLSEKMDSPLMWSHYANKHFGFCLEYDFTHSMIRKTHDLNMAKIMLLPVIYSDKRPLLSKAFSDPKIIIQYMRTKKLPDTIIENIIYGLLFKSSDWSYEHEWRIIGIDMKKPTMKLPPARKLFLGANIEDTTKNRLIDIAKKKHIPVYQMFLSSNQYKFEYYKVE